MAYPLHRFVYRRHRAARRYQTLNEITLNRQALLANFRLVKQQHPDMAVIPVLKANAYGHGLLEVAGILNDAPCRFLAVDGYFEAARLRYISRHPLLVLGYIKPENVRLVDTKRCSFVVQDIAGLKAFAGLRRRVRIHLELNTGMNRLGLQPDELDAYLKVLKRYPRLQLEGVMTHLADADNEYDNSFTKQQVAQFDELVTHIKEQGFRPPVIHVAQTAGSTKASSQFASAFRLGIGLYGINPLSTKDAHYQDLAALQPVLSLKSTIIKTIDLQPGDRVSYNGIFTADKPMRIGILPLGYYEGVPRALSNIGRVSAGQLNLPIVGRICMNHTMINLEGSNLGVGDQVTVISDNPDSPNSVANLSARHNLFAYELVTKLSSSIRRSQR